MAEKEHALSENRIRRIGKELRAVCPDFDAEAFVRDVLSSFPRLGSPPRAAASDAGPAHQSPHSQPAGQLDAQAPRVFRA